MPEPTRTGLSLGAEVLVRRLTERADDPFDCDALVVGSGYGGAVAAARLAGSYVSLPNGGIRPAVVWLLERGLEHSPGTFPSRFSELAGHVRFNTQSGGATRGRDEGLFDFRIGGDVSALLGNGLGGGSLINAGVMAEPDAQVFAAGWPAAINATTLQSSYQKALDMLQPQALVTDHSRRWRAFQAVAGANGTVATHCPVAVNLGAAQPNTAGVTLQTCTHCGDCVTGCNQAAKGTLDTNYLAWARAREVELFCGGAVQHVLRDDATGNWRVTWHFTERSRRPPELGPYVIRARHVVLAAGSFGSTEILMRSRKKGLWVSGAVGSRFSTNGDFLAAGVAHKEKVCSSSDQESDPADRDARSVGPTITGMVRVPQADGTLPIVAEEFSVPAALRRVFGELVGTLHAWDPDQPLRSERGDPMAVTDDSIDRCSLYGLMGDDGARGTLEFPARLQGDAFEGVLLTRWKDVTSTKVFQHQADWLRAGLTPNCEADEPLIMHPLQAFEVGTLTVHPLGGCPMANTGVDGVVDAIGRVFCGDTDTHPGLVVLDGSIVPRALGINPSLTIAALAEHAVPELMRHWQWIDSRPTPQPLPERRALRRREQPAASADWLIRERMHGLISFGVQRLWAQLDITFAPIPGFAKSLALNPLVAGIRQATLTMWEAPENAEPLTFRPDSSTCIGTAELAGQVRLFEPNDVDLEPPRRLVYQLSVQSVQSVGGRPQLPLQVGSRLDGVKHFGQPSGQLEAVNLWRQLTELKVRCDGNAGIGRLMLDVDDLATQREPLLRLVDLSTMPDALGDGGALLLYVLRQSMQALSQLIANPFGAIEPHHLHERWPTELPECHASVTHVGDAGARLTHYERPFGPVEHLPPVVLIHGLGTSGSSFAHACLPDSLVRHLRRELRDVWVLDLRSSVGNEPLRKDGRSAEWTVDSVARDDIPAAIASVLTATHEERVDVVAHCMGAVMFCFAALSSQAMEDKVRAVVLSQVGPLARLSPLNRLRGYLASYLQQFIGIEELDTSPEFESRIEADNTVTWFPTTASAISLILRDLLPNSFPYPDDDQERARFESLPAGSPDFRSVRHRADMIFGQLFELKNVCDTTLSHLDALFGWVKVKMLAQAIHFARHNMLTDARGRNSLFEHEHFNRRFRFPILIVHGRRNRVFDWRGSLDSLELLKKLRKETDAKAPPQTHDQITHYGQGTPTQLAVIEGYGHLDCVIGRKAHEDVFPTLSAFFSSPVANQQAKAYAPDPVCEQPWIGPMLGWLRHELTPKGAVLQATVLVQAPPRRARTRGVLIVPVMATANGTMANVKEACVLRRTGPRWQHLSTMPTLQEGWALKLVFNPMRLNDGFDTFAVLTIHDDVPLPDDVGAGVLFAEILNAGDLVPEAIEQFELDAMFTSNQWLLGAEEPDQGETRALEKFILDDDSSHRLQRCLFSLPTKVRDAADTGQSAASAKAIGFGLASCQYPPGLLDELPAGASYRQLQKDAEEKDGPQFVLLIGDQIYADATAGVFEPTVIAGSDASPSRADFDRIYELNWRMPAMRRTAARMPMLTMLDDHEIADNWQPYQSRRGVDEAEALAAFERYQQVLNPTRRISAASPRSYAVFPAGVPFWVLDTRSQRVPRQVGHGGPYVAVENAEIIPQQAMQALFDALSNAPAEIVKFIVSPSPILPPERHNPAAPEERLRADNWAGYPTSAFQLLDFIRERNIRRVVILAGDAHLSSVSTFTFEDEDNQVTSIVSSGLYTPWPFANQAPSELILQGEHDFGRAGAHCRGLVTVQALSAEAGYALINVDTDGARHVGIRVSLRTARGASIETALPLV
jgi:choline dehydrogenase-like flavoprotein/pimeloyl-ACP methyl ester carboxylesterase